MEESSLGDDFIGLVRQYTIRAISSTRAKGNSKYILEDLFTEFGDQILNQVKDIICEKVKEEIDEFRF